MTAYSKTTDVVVTTASTNAIDITTFDYVYVAQGVNVSASGAGGNAIRGVANDRVTVEGDAFGEFIGIWFSGSSGTNNILVSRSGSVVGLSYGIYSEGDYNKLTNAGTVASFNGVTFAGGNNTIHNTGLIQGESYAIYLNGASSSSNRILNSGDILSTSVAMSLHDAADTVINTGLIAGTVLLGAGNDVFDSRGGIVQGHVDLGTGNDTAYGGDRADDIFGGDDDDLIRGKQDDDRLDGGDGKDRLIGGEGEDQFVFSTTLGIANVDTIADFTHGEDQIVLSATIFAALGTAVGSSEFVARSSGHIASTSGQHLIYDLSKGTLWYDVDGVGGAAAVKFAQLGTSTAHPMNLSYLDFVIA